MKQIEVINLETIIDVTAETSNVEILVQDYDSELAERFALEAQEAAIDAEESADIATAQASIATAQAGIATTQASIATTQAGNALTSANNAAASAQEAQDIVDSIITADLTEATSSVLTITGGTDAVLGTGTTIQVKQAGSSQSGFLSSTDWTTFNSKQNTITNPVTGTGASGQVAFWNGTSSQTGDNGLFWDNTNKRLGVGTNAPLSSSVYINNSANGIQQHLILKNSNIGSNAQVHLDLHNNAGGSDYAAGASLFFCSTTTASPYASALGFWNYQNGPIALATNALERMRVSSGGNVLINTTTDAGFRLDVNGTARVQGVLTTTADAVVNGVNVGRGGASITTNTRVGTNALNANTTGTNNTAFGESALNISTTAGANSAFGNRAGVNITTGGSNSLFGRAAGEAINTGTGNTFIGALSGVNITTGASNIFIGFNVGRFIADGVTPNTTASASIFIGENTRANADNQTNQIVIGHNSIGLGSNTTVIGNSSTTFGRWFGNLLIGTSTNSTFALDVNGTARVQGTVANALTVQRTTATSNIYIRYQNATNSWYAGQTDTGSFGIGTDAALGGGILFNLTTGGNLLLGTVTNAASSILTMQSTTQGFLPPRMTTTQKNAIASPATGLVVYDNTLNKLSVFTGATWQTVTSL